MQTGETKEAKEKPLAVSTDERMLAGRYRVGNLIGRGGMAEVHEGTDTRLGRKVAIKLLQPHLADDPNFRTRFRQEAQSAARMAHPTIVRVYDAGEEVTVDEDGHEKHVLFIIMELVQGRLLKDVISDGPVEPPLATKILTGVLTALEYSHRAGVVHRDIKPGNIMLTPAGQVKVMDFGIARAVSDSSTTVAQTTAILGTAAYFSPEQAKGETVDARTDLYSTGIVLFELLTGRAPFRGDTAVAVAYQHVSEQPVKPSTLNPKVSPALDTVVLHSLAKSRTERYQSAAEFRDDLEVAASGRVPVHNQPQTTTLLFNAPTGSLSSQELQLRQLTEDETMARTQRRPPAIWIWSGIVGVVLIVIAVMYWAFNLQPNNTLPETSARVPTLVGKTYDEAVAELKKGDLPASRVDEVSDTVEAGKITRTDPPADVVVNKGTVITVYVSSGQQPVTIPNVENMPLESAKQALQEAGLVPGTETKVNSATAAEFTVLSANPAGGTSVAKGSTVDLQISNGQVTVPDLTGQTLAAATSFIQSETLQLTAVPVPDSSCPSETGSPITKQSIGPGEVPQKSEVELTYCSGEANQTSDKTKEDKPPAGGDTTTQ